MESIIQEIEIENSIETLVEEGQTTIHCWIKNAELMRIWKTTFLIGNDGEKYQLVHAIDIGIHPNWSSPKMINGKYRFTLIFEKLKPHTQTFYVDEQITEPDGFYTNDLVKNNVGIYDVEILTKIDS